MEIIAASGRLARYSSDHGSGEETSRSLSFCTSRSGNVGITSNNASGQCFVQDSDANVNIPTGPPLVGPLELFPVAGGRLTVTSVTLLLRHASLKRTNPPTLRDFPQVRAGNRKIAYDRTSANQTHEAATTPCFQLATTFQARSAMSRNPHIAVPL